MIRVVLPVGDNDMVKEVDVHHFTGPHDALCQLVICTAGCEVAGGVIVADSKDRGVGEYGLPHDDTDIDGSFCDASM